MKYVGGWNSKGWNILGVHKKFWFSGEGDHEKPIYNGGLPKKGDLRGCLARKRGWWFCGGGCWYPNAHYDLSYH